MKYQEYKAEDFASDESFQNYFYKNNREDRGYWEDWIDQNPEKEAEVNKAIEILETMSFHLKREETHLALQRLKKGMNEPNSLRKESSNQSYALKIASIAAVFFVLIAAIFYFNSQHSPDWNIVKADFGKQQQIELPDGSSVLLNSNSKIRFDNNWTNQTYREVWIEGEAYFDVTKNPKKGKKKFLVHAGKGLVEVLGTSFNVYNRKNYTEVALESGSVNFQHISKVHEKYLMKPKDVIQMNHNKIEQLQGVDLSLYTSWKEHKLKLKKTPITKVINALRDNFGYEVTIKNKSILDRKLTATIPIQDVDILLQALQEIYQLDIKKEGNKIYIE